MANGRRAGSASHPIETLPIGVRVPTKNPNRWEVDPQPEPEQATWAKLSITVERSDGGIVDAELIRPRSWILANGICAGRLLPMNLPELDVSGLAMVTSIDDCPPIADGEGSVVTARFVTREVHIVASVDVLGADGSVETITGTTIHPIWSVDRQAWVPLGELVEGETLQGQDGLAAVLSVTLSRVAQPVYNIEVHGEHVYQVGGLGVLVHNAWLDCVKWVTDATIKGDRILLKGRGRELISIPGYTDKVFHHAFIKDGDLLFDVVFTEGTNFNGWVKKVASDNGKSVDEILAMMGQLPEGFR
jgi:hypothetical protein